MIPEQIPVKNHFGNNSATTFDFNFLIESEDELYVEHTDLSGNVSVLTRDVDYSIYEVGNENGSYITFPLQNSNYKLLAWDAQSNKKEVLSISLNLPIEQQSEYDISSNLNPNVLEKCFDYLTRICQVQERKIERAIKVSEGSNVNPEELSSAIENITNFSTALDELSNVEISEINLNDLD